MTVRAKFKVQSITESEGGIKTAKLYPVTGGSPENAEFYKWTPSGSIDLLFGVHRVELFQGDCLEILRQVPEGIADAVITDPPYGIAYKPKAKHLRAIVNDARPFIWWLVDTMNPAAAAQFKPGRECFVEFVFADE